MSRKTHKAWARLGAGLLLIVFGVLLSYPGAPRAARAQGGGWDVPQNISNTPGASRFARLAADLAGNLHVVWSENVDTQPGAWGNAIYYTQYRQGQWSTPVDIVYNGLASAHLPAVAVDDKGFVHLIWTDTVHLYHQQAHIERATSASGWSAQQIISWGGQESAYWSDIVIVGDTIHVTWSGSPEGLWDIAYTRSTDGGHTWVEPVQVTNTDDIMETRPRLAISHDGVVHLVWSKNEPSDAGIGVCYSRSLDGGQSWDEPLNLSDLEGVAGAAAIAIDHQGLIHVVWQQAWASSDTRNYGFWHRFSADEGVSWSMSTRVDKGYAGSAPTLSLAVDASGELHFTWQQQTDYPRVGLFYATWKNRLWSPPVELVPDQGDSRPQIAVTEGNRLHIIWARGRDDDAKDIFYTSTTTDAPRIPPRAFPTPVPEATPTAMRLPTAVHTPEPSPTPMLTSLSSPPEHVDTVRTAWISLLAGVTPALLLVIAVIIGARLLRSP